MGVSQSNLLAPVLLAFGAACTNEARLPERPLELASVGFEDKTYMLYELGGRSLPNITAVDNEPDLQPSLIALKTELLKLADITGYLLKVHETTGLISSYLPNSIEQVTSAKTAAVALNDYICNSKYPGQINFDLYPSCGGVYVGTTGYDKTEAIAFRVADVNNYAISAIARLEEVEDSLAKQAQDPISVQKPTDLNVSQVQIAWEGINSIRWNLDRAEMGLADLVELNKR